MTRDVGHFLSEQLRKFGTNPEMYQEWTTLENLYNKKLWHQLTLKLMQLVKNPQFSKSDALVQIYQNFISDFEHRINPLALVEIAIIVSKQIKDPNDMLKFLEKIKEAVKLNNDSLVLCMTAIGNVKLQMSKMEDVKVIIKEAEKILDEMMEITSVHGRFFELSSNYNKLMANYAEYYRDALRFLGCIDITEIPLEEQKERAMSLGLAAILGKDLYNFGELLAHPILNVMIETEHQWLVDLLHAFNSGNIEKFNNLQSQWMRQSDLNSHRQEMQEKIALLCLMEMAFKRPTNQSMLTFEQIAGETQINLNEVELLVMKALSLKLIHGSIDELEQKVHITWVQPRVLDKQQLSSMKERMQKWYQDVDILEVLIESKAHELIT